MSHDAFRWRALGKNACLLQGYLTAQPWSSARKLALAAGVHPATTTRLLAKLAGVGLARRTEAGWMAGSGTLEAAAVVLNTAGDGLRQRERHQAERAQRQRDLADGHRRWLDDRRRRKRPRRPDKPRPERTRYAAPRRPRSNGEDGPSRPLRDTEAVQLDARRALLRSQAAMLRAQEAAVA